MPHLNPTWQVAVAVAVLFLLTAAATRWRGLAKTSAALTEAALVVCLFAAWQVIGAATHRNVAGATNNALRVHRTEAWLHLPSELTLQQLLLPHSTLSQLANGYYLYGHFNPMIAVLGWTWLRHRQHYPRLRLQLGLLTALAFVVHAIPVAPPRLLPQLGFQDLALTYGQSVYGSFGAGIPGQLLAMPSLHVGWSVLVGWTVVRLGRTRWRWLALLHPVLMAAVVVVTANHWWLDGVVACGLLGLAIALAQLVLWLLARRPAAARPAGRTGAPGVAEAALLTPAA